MLHQRLPAYGACTHARRPGQAAPQGSHGGRRRATLCSGCQPGWQGLARRRLECLLHFMVPGSLDAGHLAPCPLLDLQEGGRQESFTLCCFPLFFARFLQKHGREWATGGGAAPPGQAGAAARVWALQCSSVAPPAVDGAGLTFPGMQASGVVAPPAHRLAARRQPRAPARCHVATPGAAPHDCPLQQHHAKLCNPAVHAPTLRPATDRLRTGGQQRSAPTCKLALRPRLLRRYTACRKTSSAGTFFTSTCRVDVFPAGRRRGGEAQR